MTSNPPSSESDSDDVVSFVAFASAALAASIRTRRHTLPKESSDDVWRRLRFVDVESFIDSYRITPTRFNEILKTLGWRRGTSTNVVDAVHPGVAVLASLKQLAFGVSSRGFKETFGMSRQRMDFYLKKFCKDLILHYRKRFLEFDLSEVIRKNEARHNVPGMLGSLDCTHIQWNMCPASYKGHFSGRSRKPTIVLEAVADSELRFIHSFFGYPGSNNDLTVLKGSPFMNLMATGKYPRQDYKVGGEDFTIPFVLVDGIYPPYATFIKAPKNERAPQDFESNLKSSWRSSAVKGTTSTSSS